MKRRRALGNLSGTCCELLGGQCWWLALRLVMPQEVIRYLGPHQSSLGTVLGELDPSGCGAESCPALSAL